MTCPTIAEAAPVRRDDLELRMLASIRTLETP